VQYLKSRPEDTAARSSLQFVFSALEALKHKNPLTESFLVQLDVDIEGTPLRDLRPRSATVSTATPLTPPLTHTPNLDNKSIRQLPNGTRLHQSHRQLQTPRHHHLKSNRRLPAASTTPQPHITLVPPQPPEAKTALPSLLPHGLDLLLHNIQRLHPPTVAI
jgi:hypothetical protein